MKRVVIVLIGIVVIISLLVGIRYFKYRNIIGDYEVREGIGIDNTKKLKLNLYSWSIGEEKDLKCDLWGCNGCQNGYYYETKNNKIYLKFKDGLLESKIEIKDDNLIIDDVVYKKV